MALTGRETPAGENCTHTNSHELQIHEFNDHNASRDLIYTLVKEIHSFVVIE